jgi:hypothetical protein
MLTKLEIETVAYGSDSRFFAFGATPSPVQLMGLHLLMGKDAFGDFMDAITGNQLNAKKVTEALSNKATFMCGDRRTNLPSPVPRMAPLSEEKPEAAEQGVSFSTKIILDSLFACAVAFYLHQMYEQDGEGNAITRVLSLARK